LEVVVPVLVKGVVGALDRPQDAVVKHTHRVCGRTGSRQPKVATGIQPRPKSCPDAHSGDQTRGVTKQVSTRKQVGQCRLLAVGCHHCCPSHCSRLI
jgi:hypothetical protein